MTKKLKLSNIFKVTIIYTLQKGKYSCNKKKDRQSQERNKDKKTNQIKNIKHKNTITEVKYLGMGSSQQRRQRNESVNSNIDQ